MNAPTLARAVRLSAAILVAGWVSGCAGPPGPRVIRLGHGLDTQHPVHRAMVYFGEELEARSHRALRLEVYPSEQLGTERECLELLQIGSLDLTKVSTSVLEGFVPTFRLFGQPYLFRDRRHREEVLTGPIGRRILVSAEKRRLRGLCFYEAGSRSFYTRTRPIRVPEDLRGLKVRTQESASAIAMVKKLGGSPTPLAWGELYTALQQGVVDGAENNPPSYHLSRHFEVAKYLSLDEHTSVPDVLLVSTALWENLSDEERGWMQAAAEASATFQRSLWLEAETRALEAVRAAGVEITEPDKAAFAALAAPLRDPLRADPELGPLLREIER